MSYTLQYLINLINLFAVVTEKYWPKVICNAPSLRKRTVCMQSCPKEGRVQWRRHTSKPLWDIIVSLFPHFLKISKSQLAHKLHSPTLSESERSIVKQRKVFLTVIHSIRKPLNLFNLPCLIRLMLHQHSRLLFN